LLAKAPADEFLRAEYFVFRGLAAEYLELMDSSKVARDHILSMKFNEGGGEQAWELLAQAQSIPRAIEARIACEAALNEIEKSS
jgi:hypothetical protein